MSTKSTNNLYDLKQEIDIKELNYTFDPPTSQLHEPVINTNKAKYIGFGDIINKCRKCDEPSTDFTSNDCITQFKSSFVGNDLHEKEMQDNNKLDIQFDEYVANQMYTKDMNNDQNNIKKQNKEISKEMFKQFKELIDPNAEMHGSQYNGTYNKYSDLDIKTTSFKNIEEKLKSQNKFKKEKYIQGKKVTRLILNQENESIPIDVTEFNGEINKDEIIINYIKYDKRIKYYIRLVKEWVHNNNLQFDITIGYPNSFIFTIMALQQAIIEGIIPPLIKDETKIGIDTSKIITNNDQTPESLFKGFLNFLTNKQMYYLINLRQIKKECNYNWRIIIPGTENIFNGMGNGQSEVISQRAIISLKTTRDVQINMDEAQNNSKKYKTKKMCSLNIDRSPIEAEDIIYQINKTRNQLMLEEINIQKDPSNGKQNFSLFFENQYERQYAFKILKKQAKEFNKQCQMQNIQIKDKNEFKTSDTCEIDNLIKNIDMKYVRTYQQYESKNDIYLKTFHKIVANKDDSGITQDRLKQILNNEGSQKYDLNIQCPQERPKWIQLFFKTKNDQIKAHGILTTHEQKEGQ